MYEEAAALLARAGVPAGKVHEAARGALALAKVGSLSAEEAATNVAHALSGFDLK